MIGWNFFDVGPKTGGEVILEIVFFEEIASLVKDVEVIQAGQCNLHILQRLLGSGAAGEDIKFDRLPFVFGVVPGGDDIDGFEAVLLEDGQESDERGFTLFFSTCQ